jgi:hypothetical protein
VAPAGGIDVLHDAEVGDLRVGEHLVGGMIMPHGTEAAKGLRLPRWI